MLNYLGKKAYPLKYGAGVISSEDIVECEMDVVLLDM